MKHVALTRLELKAAKKIWPDAVHALESEQLQTLIKSYGFSVKRGDLQILNRRWYVTHTGLLGLAYRKRCCGVHTRAIREFCEAASSRWAFKAVVYTSHACKGFVGYGDADPSNVSPQVRGAEMRVAETRAVNRALRKAYGIGLCSVEELGSFSGPLPRAAQTKKPNTKAEPVDGHNGHYPLRNRLGLLIRQHRLNPALVKAYAADYCDVCELRRARREQVATFIQHLAEYAQNDRAGLLCQLNSYAPKLASTVRVTSANNNPATEQEKAGAA